MYLIGSGYSCGLVWILMILPYSSLLPLLISLYPQVNLDKY
jgi:hypothetical protein